MPLTDAELLDEIKRLLDDRETSSDTVPDEPNFSSLSLWATKNSAQGQKGEKTPRMNLAIDEDVYEYIRKESRKEGMTYSEFICAVMRQRGNFINVEESNQAWQRNFELYSEFRKTFCREPRLDEPYGGISLGKWVARQKLALKNGSLSDDKIQKLLVVGFIFDPQVVFWQKNYELYIAFKQEHGRDPKPDESYQGCNLGLWVAFQRKAFYSGTLSEERKQKLLDAGFEF